MATYRYKLLAEDKDCAPFIQIWSFRKSTVPVPVDLYESKSRVDCLPCMLELHHLDFCLWLSDTRCCNSE
jgi:hypothetical protein